MSASAVSLSPFEVTIGGMDLLAALGGLALGETDFIVVGAEIGIVLLLFFLGLEFNLDRLLASRDRIGKAGSVDLAINFGTGLVFGYLVFGSFLAAFLTAGIVYISSSAIITKSLIDLGWIANDEAEPLLGTLVYEDLFIAVYLTIASALVWVAAMSERPPARSASRSASSSPCSHSSPSGPASSSAFWTPIPTSSSSSGRSASRSSSPESRSRWALARPLPRSSSA